MYFSLYWTRYFWSYVDYDSTGENTPLVESIKQATLASPTPGGHGRLRQPPNLIITR
jgi:hypothetical protein